MDNSRKQHRSLTIFAGSHSWGQKTLLNALAETSFSEIPWIGSSAPEGFLHLTMSGTTQLLGKEFDLAIFNMYDGFDADAFGAISGTIRGGGQLLLLAPPLADWQTFDDPDYQRLATWPYQGKDFPGRFLDRLARLFQSDDAVSIVTPESDPFRLDNLPSTFETLHREDTELTLTSDQKEAVEAIKQVVHGHRRRPLVITADRGRGKSSALGIAAAELLLQGKDHILVTAPSPAAVAPLFQHANNRLSNFDYRENSLSREGKSIRFVAPDELIRNPQPADLLIIDEAAAIPAPLLESLLKKYSRAIFSTTVHGYEGTGRGFAVRFRNRLNSLTPNWKKLTMNSPVRWLAEDPLERLTFNALLLDADAAEESHFSDFRIDQLKIEFCSQDELIQNEQLLRELFGLLVTAHYKTRPLDLRQLLDGPNIRIWIARYRDRVAGVALGLTEGGFEQEMENAILRGQRRPHGHLAPQTLATHCAISNALKATFLRIMRIAVHPAIQRKSVGHKIVNVIKAESDDADCLCTSFGATTDLLDFWNTAGFRSVRVGISREASSGCHSVLMMMPKSGRDGLLTAKATQRFQTLLPLLLSDQLKQLEAALILKLFHGFPEPISLSAESLELLRRFSQKQIPFDACLLELQQLITWAAISGAANNLDASQQQIILARLLQQRAITEIVSDTNLSGRKEFLQQLQSIVSLLLTMHEDTDGT